MASGEVLPSWVAFLGSPDEAGALRPQRLPELVVARGGVGLGDLGADDIGAGKAGGIGRRREKQRGGRAASPGGAGGTAFLG